MEKSYTNYVLHHPLCSSHLFTSCFATIKDVAYPSGDYWLGRCAKSKFVSQQSLTNNRRKKITCGGNGKKFRHFLDIHTLEWEIRKLPYSRFLICLRVSCLETDNALWVRLQHRGPTSWLHKKATKSWSFARLLTSLKTSQLIFERWKKWELTGLA